MPRSLVHVLLSLLLLLAQQASMLHVASDWGRAGSAALAQAQLKGQAQDGSADDGKLATGALHDACALCMDSAQLAFALPLPALAFAPLQLSFDAPRASCGAGIHLLGSCVFQPRGPPHTA